MNKSELPLRVEQTDLQKLTKEASIYASPTTENNYGDLIVDQCLKIDADYIIEKVNNHNRLISQNKKLQDALKTIEKILSKLS